MAIVYLVFNKLFQIISECKIMITGIPASPGIVFGKALVLKEEKIVDRKSTRLNSSHITRSRMPSSA